MVKALKNLLWNQKAHDHETWYAASGAQVLPSLFKWWPWVDLDLFHGKVKFASVAFYMGKSFNCRFLKNYWNLCNKTWYINSAKCVHEYLWVPKVKVIQWRLSKVFSVYNNFKHLLLRNHWTDWSQISCGASMGLIEQNFIKMVQVTWPRWPPCLYKVKTFKNLLIKNKKVDDLETWYATLGTWVLLNLFKCWHWVDLDLFYSKVRFAFLRLLYGKKLKL